MDQNKQSLIDTVTNRKEQNRTEKDRNGKKDINGQKRTGTDRNKQQF